MLRKFIQQCFNTSEFEILSAPFIMFCAAGVWCPSNWSSRAKSYYTIYTVFQLSITAAFGIQLIIYNWSVLQYFYFNINSLFGFIAVSTSLFKFGTFYYDREWLILMVKMAFSERFCIPKNSGEKQIIERMSIIRWNVHAIYLTVLGLAAVVKVLSPYFRPTTEEELQADKFLNLPMAAWYPYDVIQPGFYKFTYVQQIVAAFLSVMVTIGGDLIMSGIMLQICLQCRVLKHRILNSTNIDDDVMSDYDNWRNDQKNLSQFVQDHLFILSVATKFNVTFTTWMKILVFSAIPNLLMNFYGAIKFSGYDKIAPISLVMICVSELFVLCWCGNEVTLHSFMIADCVFGSNWIDTHFKVRKGYILIMLRSVRRPMILSIAKIIPLNVDCLVKILKTAYSIFQIVRRVDSTEKRF